MVNALIGGYQLGWVGTYQSGTPIGVGASNVLPIFGGGNRPNLVPGVNPRLSSDNFDPATDLVINSAAFSQPADFTFGDAPRVLGELRNFPYFNENVNLSKYFRFTESVNLQLRVEFFNVFNRVVRRPKLVLLSDNANFGRVAAKLIRLASAALPEV